ncbi:hypothetical protein P167DRAFT_478482, partial [Morchella conica CCBAS932]
ILRAHIALISGDTMAMAKLMKWTGPNSYRDCRFCAIYRISERHIFCPLGPPRDRDPPRSWDPNNLPVWTDKGVRYNQTKMEDTIDAVWGKLMGTSGAPIFSCLRSIVYRWVFAPDTMHLLDENTPRLYLAHRMGVYRDKEIAALSHMQSKTKICDKIGAEIADSRCTIPSAFGKAFRDIKYHASYKATELMNFMHLISPVMLNQRLPAQYYDH